MSNALVLLEGLRERGVVLAITDDGRLRCRSRPGALSTETRQKLRLLRDEILELVRSPGLDDPNLNGVCGRWRTVTGGSAAEFVVALNGRTGCDFHERNPTAEELRVMDRYVHALEKKGGAQ